LLIHLVFFAACSSLFKDLTVSIIKSLSDTSNTMLLLWVLRISARPCEPLLLTSDFLSLQNRLLQTIVRVNVISILNFRIRVSLQLNSHSGLDRRWKTILSVANLLRGINSGRLIPNIRHFKIKRLGRFFFILNSNSFENPRRSKAYFTLLKPKVVVFLFIDLLHVPLSWLLLTRQV
jgi:hypothetical protein